VIVCVHLCIIYAVHINDYVCSQVFGSIAYMNGGTPIRRRKFGKILKLRENGLLTDFNTLPNHVERDGLYKEAFDAKYFEPTFEAKPFMATFDTNQIVNQGKVFRTVRCCSTWNALVSAPDPLKTHLLPQPLVHLLTYLNVASNWSTTIPSSTICEFAKLIGFTLPKSCTA
jgi:hypothetical protein